MMPHKPLPATAAAVLLLVASLNADPPVTPPPPPLPTISDAQRTFLSRVARRTIRDAMLARPSYEPEYIPDELRGVDAEVVVRLRERGFLRDAGVGGPGPISVAVRDAAVAAVHSLAGEKNGNLDLAGEMLVEIEIIGPPEPINIDVDWTEPRAIDPFIEPGVHGFIFRSKTQVRRFCPTEIFTSDMIVADALKSMAQQIGGTRQNVADVQLYRFRTLHWYEEKSGTAIVSLHRGLTVLPPAAVTRENLSAGIDRLAEYMAYRQTAGGLFSYQYECGADVYTPEDNLVRQAGAVAAMAWHARASGKSASLAAADAGIRWLLGWKKNVEDPKDVSFIATPDGANKLGVTALTCIALARHPNPAQYAEERRRLVNGMVLLQRPSGLFATAFPPAQDFSAQDYFPGEALVAMALHYELTPDARVLEAFDRAIAFYRDRFQQSPSPAFVPWQVQAYCVLAKHSKRQDYTQYVFELTDWLVAQQLTPANCSWPEMWGGVAAYQEGRAGVATAAYLEGLADALVLARDVGDVERARRYEQAVRLAARFVMQLQVRPEEAYFVRSPQDAVGGIRTSPSLNLLRIDHSQHALVGLIKAREALFPQ